MQYTHEHNMLLLLQLLAMLTLLVQVLLLLVVLQQLPLLTLCLHQPVAQLLTNSTVLPSNQVAIRPAKKAKHAYRCACASP